MKKIFLVLTLSLALISNHANAIDLTTQGPGNRIHGIDISKWQHPNNKAIDFKKMAAAGVRFVIIKGSDAQTLADAQALKYLKIDRTAAQAEGIYTGFYHYAYLPDTTDTTRIITDAKAQAQKVIWRLASIGGYNELDLPVALDLENNCVRKSGSVCTKFINKKYVTLWAQTWLDEVAAKTNRKPMVYSYPQFLQTAMIRSKGLAQYPLWIAAYGKSPATAQPGIRTVGCFAHSWTMSNCQSNWQIWQYTSCGIGSKYGIPTSRVDLNVFGGDQSSFIKLASGTWQPDAFEQLPYNEATTMKIVSQSIADTNGTSTFVIDVFRPDGSPVVTGTVNFTSLDSLMSAGVQDPVRSESGRWTLKIKGMQAGNYIGLINFVDESQVHAANFAPIQFTVGQGAVLPSPSPTKKPTTKPTTPVDSCKGQIRN
jgi:GH25 family lysozyme M1 (1,4-beta-N-acetylmuramidase)